MAVCEKQSIKNFEIKSTRKAIHTSYFSWMYTTLIRNSGAEPVSVPKIENTYYSHCVYMLGHKSKRKVQTAVRSSWSDLGKKSKFKSMRVSTSSRTAFWKGTKVEINLVLKIESDSGINSIPG